MAQGGEEMMTGDAWETECSDWMFERRSQRRVLRRVRKDRFT